MAQFSVFVFSLTGQTLKLCFQLKFRLASLQDLHHSTRNDYQQQLRKLVIMRAIWRVHWLVAVM